MSDPRPRCCCDIAPRITVCVQVDCKMTTQLCNTPMCWVHSGHDREVLCSTDTDWLCRRCCAPNTTDPVDDGGDGGQVVPAALHLCADFSNARSKTQY